MSSLEEIQLKFNEVYKNRPSILRTTLMYGPLGWVMRILGWLFLLSGLGLLIAMGMGAFLFEIPNTDQKISNAPEAYQRLVLILQAITGIACVLIGLVLIFIGRLCRKIVTRNMYIIDLEEIFENKKEALSGK